MACDLRLISVFPTSGAPEENEGSTEWGRDWVPVSTL
jgi:hypothetical protein